MASKGVHIADMYEALASGALPGGFNTERTRFTFPTVQSRNSRGATLLWKVSVRLVRRAGRGNAGANKHAAHDFAPVTITDEMLKQPVSQLPGMAGEITVESCQEGGKIRDTVPTYVTKGKSLGRKNATNVITQALRNALGMHNRQKKRAGKRRATSVGQPAARSAKKEPPPLDFRPPPMLVKKEGATHAATISPGWYGRGLTAQRKYNGVRMVAYLDGANNVVLYSRTGTLYPGFRLQRSELLPNLQDPPSITRDWLAEGSDRAPEEVSDTEVAAYHTNGRAPEGQRFLRNPRPVVYLDGESYKHGKSLRWISGQARKEEDVATLEYHIYDCFFPTAKIVGYDMHSAQRQDYLDRFFRRASELRRAMPHIVRVKNVEVRDAAHKDELFRQFLDEGFEGLIIRKDWEGYRYSYGGYHSSHLIKIKPIQDAEFAVVGYKEGKGKALGMVVWICEVDPAHVVDPDDKTFAVDPKDMTHEQRKVVYRCLGVEVEPGVTRFERDFKGKPLTVEFPERSSKTGKPTQAKATVFRTYEDSGGIDPLQLLYDECAK